MRSDGVGEGIIKFGSICVLNVLWLLCCIPIFTIGASTCALYSMTIRMVEDEEDSTVKGFFKAFKANFKRGTIAWLLLLAVGLIIYLHYFFLKMYAEGFFKIYYFIVAVEILAVSFVGAFLFPVISRYDNTVWNSIKNSFLMSITHLGTWFMVVLLWAVPIGVCLTMPEVFFTIWYLWIVPGGAFIAYITSILIRKAFTHVEKAQENAKKNQKNK